MLLFFLACTGSPTPEDSEPTVTWRAAFDTTQTGALSGVWGSGADDVWMVGGKAGAGEIYHFDGELWAPSIVPEGTDLLVWIYGFGADSAISVGESGSAVRWDGQSWTRLETGVTEDLWGVFGYSMEDIWVVGGNPDAGEPLILHYDGSHFEAVALDPAQNSRDATSIFKVWGIDGKLWAVGQNGLILGYDGSWKEMPGGAEAAEDFVSLWGTSADHVVAVGGRSNARISTFDGSDWTTVSPTGIGGLNAISMTRPDRAIIGGIYGYVARLNPENGSLVEEDLLSGGDVHALWSDGVRTYAVGGIFREPYSGLAYVREESP